MGLFHIHINIGKAFSKVEHAIGKGLGHVAHEVGHAVDVGAHAVGREVGHLAHEVGHAVDVGAHAVGREVGHLAHEVGHAAGAVGKEIGHLANTVGDFVLRLRPLRPSEIQVARSVFLDTVPYERVLLSPLSGLSSRPFTVPGTFLMSATGAASLLVPVIPPVLLTSELLAGLYNKYVIFFGSQGYQNALHHPFDQVPGQTLIHELTHVWQGHHSAFSWDYIYHSIKDQCFLGTEAAYKYNVTGHPGWSSLRVEAQANLVDHWFGRMSPTYGTLFSYVRDNIRAGSPHGKTTFNPLMPGQMDPALTG